MVELLPKEGTAPMRFSVIVAAFNVEPYIADCIESLKRQTYRDFEAIVVDDASTDETLRVARLHAGDDERFLFFEQSENAGQSAARNVGLLHATGDYVLFLDSDDYYRDDALQAIADRIAGDDLDQLYFAAETFYENRTLRRTRYEDQESRVSIDGVMSGVDLYVAFEKTEAFRPSSCLYAVRRSVIEDARLRFREGIIHEDLLFLMELMPLPRRAAFFNEPLYRRRMREGSTMTSAFSMRNVDGLFRVQQALRAWILEHASGQSQDFCDAYAARVFYTCEVAARYLFEISEADMYAYRQGLNLQDRVDFDLHILELHKALKGVYDELEGSRTYRLGRLFLAFPSWVKSRVIMPQAKRKDQE